MAKAILLRDDAHPLEVDLADVRGQCAQGRQGLFAGIDHVAEVEQRMQARVAYTVEQFCDFEALEFFMLLEVEVQVVQVRLLRQVAQVGLDEVHDPRKVAFIA
ncbi:hypothetical protein D3C78_1652410 [compost metagenome]